MLSRKAKELLALQQRKYLQSLPDKRKRVGACWRSVPRHGWQREHVDKLQTEIHRLSGSAASYGLDELGSVARNLDLLLSAGEFDDTARAAISDAMAALDEAFGQVSESG